MSQSGPLLYELALEHTRQKEGPYGKYQWSPENSLLFLGSRGVGKTTLIHRFLERNETPRQTLALEYTFARKLNKAMLAKEVCHIWELGGGSLHTSLLTTPTAPEKLRNLAAVLVLDLSQPDYLWFTLQGLVSALKQAIRESIDSIRDKSERDYLVKILDEQTWARVGNDNPDRPHMDPISIPLVILGGKYDRFQDFEPEQKKVVCRVLRYFAHVHGAALQFYSDRDSGLIRKAKDILSHHAFHTPSGKVLSQDYNKPLLIPAGADSLQSIGGPAGSGALEHWKQIFESAFPSAIDVKEESGLQGALPEDPAKDMAFREPQIDALRAQKDEELENYRRELEMKQHSDMGIDEND